MLLKELDDSGTVQAFPGSKLLSFMKNDKSKLAGFPASFVKQSFNSNKEVFSGNGKFSITCICLTDTIAIKARNCDTNCIYNAVFELVKFEELLVYINDETKIS